MSTSVEQMETDSKIASAIKQEAEDELHLNVLASQNVVIKEDIDDDVKEMRPDVLIENENKMDVDVKDVPVSISKKEEDPVHFSIKETDGGLMELTIDGIEDEEDDETVILSPEEVRAYLEDKIKEYLADPEINPFLELTKRSLELQAECKVKNEEFNRLMKLFDIIYRNQEKFLRHIGVLAKIPTKSIACSADLPVQPDALTHLTNNNLETLNKTMAAQNTVLAPIKKTVSHPVTTGTSVTKELPKTAEVSKANAAKATGSSIECIDLTDDPPNANVGCTSSFSVPSPIVKHPAPLPPRPFITQNPNLPGLPPKPRLKVHAEQRGIVLQWDMPPSIAPNSIYAVLCAFDILGYQEQPNAAITTLLWKKIGSVKAMTLPMACTLTQFLEGNKYHFSIRAMDIHNRYGSYSDPISIVYTTRPKH